MKRPRVKYYLRPSRNASHGEKIVEISVSWLGRRLQQMIGQTIDPKDWDKSRHRPKKIRRNDIRDLQRLLDDLETFVLAVVQEYSRQRRLGDLTPDILRKEVRRFLYGGASAPKVGEVVYWMEGYLDNAKAFTTLQKWRTTINHLSNFLEQKRSGYLAFEEIDYNFFCAFRDHLRETGINDNSVHKYLKALKGLMRKANQEGRPVKDLNFSIGHDLGVFPEESDSIRL